jgi:hypothetical protein
MAMEMGTAAAMGMAMAEVDKRESALQKLRKPMPFADRH